MRDPLHDFTMQLVRLCADLAALVEWCVEHDGECLGDHPNILARAQEILTRKTKLSEVRTDA